jgi:predicted O-methyltransferase YrrM
MHENEMTSHSSLSASDVSQTLDLLHNKAKRDYRSFISALPKVLMGLLTGKKLMSAVTPEMLKDAFIPVSREQGLFLYNVARSIKAKTIVEFGSSFGISTLYLAAAAKDNNGKLITTEIIPDKCRVTEQNLQKAGLNPVAVVLEGDALITLKEFDETIDLLFLDGWKNLYTDVLDMLLPRMRQGSVVIADNINLSDAMDYMSVIKSSRSGFVTTVLNKTTAFSVYVNPPNQQVRHDTINGN